MGTEHSNPDASSEDSGDQPSLSEHPEREEPPIHRVPVSELLYADTPRLSGEDEQHSRTLAETETPLPPILVHRETLRVIDGMHRLRAAEMNGQTHIDVRFFDGTIEEAFVEAVRANVAHGKPLNRREREAAAERILSSYSHWSDRAVADACGVSGKTIASLRRATEAIPQLDARVGLDGRVRPVDSAEGRHRAADVLASEPDASLRDIARRAHVSPATASDVRERVRRGADPAARRRPPPQPADVEPSPASIDEVSAQLRALREDSSLLATEGGKGCVKLFTERFITAHDWRHLADEAPLSRIYVLSDLARRCAKAWNEFADSLQARSTGH
jgi:ParB-like chromosome segregation protein Spo0J